MNANPSNGHTNGATATADEKTMDRRRFVKAGAAVGVGAAAFVGLTISHRMGKPNDPTGPGTIRSLPVLNNIPVKRNEDILVRMQRDLKKAMSKPVEERRWVMVIDSRKCVGCDACSVACTAENKLPPGVVYRPVVKEEFGEFPNVQIRFTPRPCMQCENPPCVPVCPVNATWKRPDGITTIDYDKCIGCRYCIAACPYGARTNDRGKFYADDLPDCTEPENIADSFNEMLDKPIFGNDMPWEKEASHEYAKHWDRTEHQSPAGNARKCHFCLHRLEKAQLPSCVTSCIGRATYFGDLNDADSLVAELIQQNQVQTLLPHLGTKPRVFYIV
jgi:Fe-S-cluster-containing dehydrogenase component